MALFSCAVPYVRLWLGAGAVLAAPMSTHKAGHRNKQLDIIVIIDHLMFVMAEVPTFGNLYGNLLLFRGRQFEGGRCINIT